MQVTKTNAVSFNGWETGAKKALSEVIAKMPKRKAQQAIKIVNELGKNSPNMTISASDCSIVVTPNKAFDIAGGKEFLLFSNLGFSTSPLKVLKKVASFVKEEVVALPKIKQLRERLTPVTQKFRDKFYTDYGVNLRGTDITFESKFVRTVLKNDGEDKFTIVISKFKRLDKKATDNGIKIGYSKDKLVVKDESSETSTTKRFSFNRGMENALDKISKYIDKRVRAHESATKHFAIVSAKSKIRIQKASHQIEMGKLKRNLQQAREEYWTHFFKDNPFRKFIQKVGNAIKSLKDKKAQNTRFKQETIEKKLDI